MRKMSKVLRLYNSFTKTFNTVELAGKLVAADVNNATQAPINGSFYICGPTVYSDCHVGHALTYIRADLFRRFMKSLFNVRLTTVMNITDIDDKILDKTREEFGSLNDESFSPEPHSHPFSRVSEKYYRSFLSDMNEIRVLPADLYIKVSDHIHLISSFIRRLEKSGHAYQSTNGDVHFKVNSLDAYKGRLDPRQQEEGKSGADELAKQDPRDFALWKRAKSNEPVWLYQSDINGNSIPGRPGWHVQCSAIASALFGKELDFHFGGKDLIFPHHYNEEACCCAYHDLDTSRSLHVWAKNWLHSGHFNLKDAKMSKSSGNVIAIKNFISRSSINALRLLCVYSHYRTDLNFSEDLLEKIKSIDHKINAFGNFLNSELKSMQESLPLQVDNDVVRLTSASGDHHIEEAILKTHRDIVDGVCDDFHLNVGLDSILDLSRVIYSKDAKELRPTDVIACWHLLKDWCNICGLDYGHMTSSTSQEDLLFELLSEFRQRVRLLTLKEVSRKADDKDHTSLKELLKECDIVRARMDELGFVSRDSKTS